jgi:stringent starvation protein B
VIVQLYDVFVPHQASSKQFLVPHYDIAIIKQLWSRHIKAPDKISVVATGHTDLRVAANEDKRLRRDYAGVPDGHSVPAWQTVYANESQMAEAFERAHSEGQALLEANEAKRQAVTVARPVAEAATADQDSSDVPQTQRKAGRPPKRQAAPVA